MSAYPAPAPGVIRCAIHQPHYLPWLRYLDKIARADVFILLDDVQYSKNGWQNRNRIKGANGPFLLTVPVRARFPARLNEVMIADDRFRHAHAQALRSAYGRAPGFDWLWSALAPIYDRPWQSLVELDCAMLRVFLERLAIPTPIRLSSELAVPGVASERIANLCRAVGATHYLTGAYATEVYLDPAVLASGGIALLQHDWTAPSYAQVHPRAGFIPDLSIVDLLAAEPERAGALLASSGRITALAGTAPGAGHR